MKRSLYIVFLGIFLSSICFSNETKKVKWFEYGKTHVGLESVLIQYLTIDLWFDILSDDRTNDVTNLSGVDVYEGNDYFDCYWSIQYSLMDKLVLRYTSFDKNIDIDGPIGPDQGYIVDNSNSSQHNYRYYDKHYDGSGEQKISRIISIGYPFTLKKIKSSWRTEYNLDLIVFMGLSFNTINKMDVYDTDEWIGDKVYFVDSWDSVDYTETINEIKPSIILSIPRLFGMLQSSIVYNGSDFKFMFGIGI